MRRRRGVGLATAALLTAGALGSHAAAPDRVLIVADELEQMLALAESLESGGLAASIVGQTALPAAWTPYSAVLVYIHGALHPATERRLIDYTRAGGRLVVLHHTISSGKARNEHWFDFLGVALPGAEAARDPAPAGGHYAWREHVALEVINLAPGHFITSQDIAWPETTRYTSSDRPSAEAEYPSLTLEPAEVYMNHHFTDGRLKTVLLGFAYRDDRNGVLFMQDREGWLKPAGSGWIVYLQMGHFVEEWRQPVVAQLVLNAIRWRPDPGS
jgi:hypothetical protein